jgi:hypothetical protein
MSQDRAAPHREDAAAKNLRRERRPRERQGHLPGERHSEARLRSDRRGNLTERTRAKAQGRSAGDEPGHRPGRGNPWRGENPGGARPVADANPICRTERTLEGSKAVKPAKGTCPTF